MKYFLILLPSLFSTLLIIAQTNSSEAAFPSIEKSSPNFETPLPIVKINTQGIFIPDEPSINASMGIIWNGDGSLQSSLSPANEFSGNISIERRGQTSLSIFPKNGYSIETKDENGEDMDVSFLNFPEEEDWILHGPYSDKTLIRNILAMQMARNVGQYASRTRLVELLINEEYEGVYVLMERIKKDDDRVAIAKLNAEDIAGDELTGGYIFKIDKGPIDWFSRYEVVNNPGEKLSFQYVYPKRSHIQAEQANYIQSYVDSFEIAMNSPNLSFGGKRYDEYIDLETFADHFILSELTKNVDAYRISTYMYKDKESNGGLLKAGPVWDFNIALGNVNYCNGYTDWGWMYEEHCDISNPFWWDKMMAEENFRNTVKCRWQEFQEGPLALDTLFAFIDKKAAVLASVVDRNFERWPILEQHVWPNATVPGSYAGEIDYLKSFIRNRMNWMNANIFGTCQTANTATVIPSLPFKIKPNPVIDQLSITVDLVRSGELEMVIHDVLGRKIYTQTLRDLNPGPQVFTLPISSIVNNSGLYFLQLKRDGVVLGREAFVVE